MLTSSQLTRNNQNIFINCFRVSVLWGIRWQFGCKVIKMKLVDDSKKAMILLGFNEDEKLDIKELRKSYFISSVLLEKNTLLIPKRAWTPLILECTKKKFTFNFFICSFIEWKFYLNKWGLRLGKGKDLLKERNFFILWLDFLM